MRAFKEIKESDFIDDSDFFTLDTHYPISIRTDFEEKRFILYLGNKYAFVSFINHNFSPTDIHYGTESNFDSINQAKRALWYSIWRK